MKNLNVTSKNVFDDSYQNFITASENQSIIDFFKDKPYYERTSKLAAFLGVFGFVCNVLSGLTEAVFLHQKFSLFIPFLAVAISLVLAVVLIIESIKRYTLPQFFRYWFQYKSIDFISLSIYLVAVLCSVWLSFQGSQFLPSMVTEAEVVNIDDVAARYDTMIKEAEEKQEAYFNANNWNGKLDNSSRPTYNQLTETVIQLKTEKQEAIKTEKQDNKAILAAYSEQNEKDGLQLGYITIMAEIVLFLIMAFLIYRKWRHVAQFANIENMEAKETKIRTIRTSTTASSTIPSSASVNLNNENRKQVVKTLKVDNNENRNGTNFRRCKHCNNEYIHRHHKQKYCSDTCRIAAYNKRNGTKLKYKAVKNG